MTLACFYCGCTDDRACVTELRRFDGAGRLHTLQAPCHWLQADPPVCSAPACRDRLGQDAAADLVDVLDPKAAYVPPGVWERVR